MRKLILILAICPWLHAQAPQIADTVQLKDTRTAVNSALTSLYGSRAASTASTAVNGQTCALGSTCTITTAQITESGNLYFTSGRALSAMAGLYEVPLTFTAPIIRTTNTISLNLWGSGARPVAASALGTSGNCVQWGAVGLTDAGAPCGSGGGSGTVTSAVIAGTASQITASGTCTITTTGTCTLSLPSGLLIPGTINKLTLTAPATGATFTLVDGKTFTVSNTLTFTGTDSSSVAFGAGGTVAYAGVDVNTSGQVTASHLASALPVNQGGTGTASTLTGLVRGSGSAMTAAELSGDATTSGSNAVTVTKVNGTSLAGLATGILKNTTSTGVPSIAAAGDFPTLNQNTSGTAANLSGTPTLPTGVVISIPQWMEIVAGVCQNVTASTPFNLETSNAASAICITGSNTQIGATQFTSGKFVQGHFVLLDDWISVLSVEFRFLSETAASTGNVVWSFTYACIASSGASVNPSFATAQTVSVAAGANNVNNSATLTLPTISGCSAGQRMFYRLGLDASTTAAGNEDLLSVRFKIKRTVTLL